jgi:hypothetical protein
MSPAANAGGAYLSQPVVMIAPPKKRSQLKPILIGVGSVVVVLALVIGVWVILSSSGEPSADDAADEAADTAAVGEVTEAPAGEAEEGDTADHSADEPPQWDADAPQERVGGTLFGDGDLVRTIAYQDWPFAFKVPEDFKCDENGQTAVCSADDGESTITVGWEECPGECPREGREMLREALPYQPLAELGNGDIAYSERTQVYGRWRGSLSLFVTGADGIFHARASADVLTERTEQGWQVFNDVLNQGLAKAE